MVTETQAAWAAGFFDGEGCVSLHLHTKRSGQQYPAVAIILTQKDRRPLDFFHALFGAKETISVVHRTIHKRPYFRVVYSGRRAAEVLRVLRPYLTLKGEVADVALALQQDIESLSPSERAAGLPPERLSARLALIDRAKWFNTGRWAAAETKSRGTLQ